MDMTVARGGTGSAAVPAFSLTEVLSLAEVAAFPEVG